MELARVAAKTDQGAVANIRERIIGVTYAPRVLHFSAFHFFTKVLVLYGGIPLLGGGFIRGSTVLRNLKFYRLFSYLSSKTSTVLVY